MRKLFALTAAMLFLGVGMASATDFSLSGSYFARGTFNDNVNYPPLNSTPESFMNYDHELEISPVFKIDDTTKVTMRVEMRDEVWTGDDNAATMDEGTDSGEPDDNIAIERVWGTHVFGNGIKIDVGLMGGGTWATTFGDSAGDKYRVKFTIPTSFGTVLALVEKDIEAGSIAVGEDEDRDTYVLGLVTKINDVGVKPVLIWVDRQSDAEFTPTANEFDIIIARLGLDGTFGNIGFEAEAEYREFDWAQDSAGTDYEVFGIYGNVWMTANAIKVGGLIAYGSYDTDADASFDFGGDFDGGGAAMLGDGIGWQAGDDGLDGCTLGAAYIDYAVNDKLSVGGYLGYAKSARDDESNLDGASIIEISGDITYAITPNLSYFASAGWAQFEYGDDTVDPDSSIELQHKLTFSF